MKLKNTPENLALFGVELIWENVWKMVGRIFLVLSLLHNFWLSYKNTWFLR